MVGTAIDGVMAVTKNEPRANLAATIEETLLKGIPLALNFAVKQVPGLAGLPKTVVDSLQSVSNKLEAKLTLMFKNLKDKLHAASKLPKNLVGQVHEFQVEGSTEKYRMWLAQTGKTLTVMLDGIGDAKALNLDTDLPDGLPAEKKREIIDLVAVVRTQGWKLVELLRSKPPKLKEAKALQASTGPLGDALKKLQEALALAPCKRLLAAFFCAGTLLRTPGGLQAIEMFEPGQLVLSRDEHDTGRANDYKVVEEVFERLGRVWHLTAGGRLIRTTGEHPFQEVTKGWVACQELTEGDRLVCEDGSIVVVEEVVDTGEVEVVYNLRVADWHTYFVGGEDWGFAVWRHNVSCQELVAEVVAVTGNQNPFADTPGLAKQIADAMTAYEANPSREWRRLDEALSALDQIHGVGPATAAKIFWDILLKIGPRYTAPEQGVTLTNDRLDLMQKALYRKNYPEQTVDIVLRANSDYYLPNRSAHYFTDSKGRLDRVEFNLKSNSLTNGGNNNTTWMGYLGEPGDVGGHLAGKQFNGLNNYPNIIPMNGVLNSYPYHGYQGGGFAQVESIWVTALSHARNVTNISVTLNYGTDNLRPTSFDIKFAIRGAEFQISFANSNAPISTQQQQVLANALAAANAP